MNIVKQLVKSLLLSSWSMTIYGVLSSLPPGYQHQGDVLKFVTIIATIYMMVLYSWPSIILFLHNSEHNIWHILLLLMLMMDDVVLEILARYWGLRNEEVQYFMQITSLGFWYLMWVGRFEIKVIVGGQAGLVDSWYHPSWCPRHTIIRASCLYQDRTKRWFWVSRSQSRKYSLVVWNKIKKMADRHDFKRLLWGFVNRMTYWQTNYRTF